MFRGIEARSCALAWAAACKSIMATKNEGYNVIIDVADPVKHDAKDNTAISLVDKFLKLHDESPIVTVANTIFPQALYEAHGSSRVLQNLSTGISTGFPRGRGSGGGISTAWRAGRSPAAR